MRTVMLWGHEVEDYQEMFDLEESDWQKSILEFGSGPSAVNETLTKKGHKIVSCCPLFNLDADTLRLKSELIFHEKVEEIIKEQDKFDFTKEGGIEALIDKRQAGMKRFMADYLQGLAEGRYQAVNDIQLPFSDFSFDLALSAHYFFADLVDQDVTFHLNMIKEIARVAKEVRIFPLIDRQGQSPTLLGPVLLGLQQAGLGVEVRKVVYHLEPKGNALLRVWAQACERI